MAASAQILPFPSSRAPQPGGATDADAPSPFLPVTKLQKQYTDYVGAKQAENAESAEADRYFHGVQWDDADLHKLRQRGQPEITYNRIKRKINTIVGIIERSRQDPKAWPTRPGPGAEDGAELCTKTVRQALGWDWQDKSSQIARRASIRGISGVELVLTPSRWGDHDIELDEVDQRDFFYDPKSGKRDFSDARYMGTTKWTDIEDIESQWPDKAGELSAWLESVPASWERGDERSVNWLNREKHQVRLVDHWYRRGGQWFYTIYAGDVVLEEGPSPFYDERRQSMSKFIMMSAEIDHENDRYGHFRDLKSPQDEVNMRRSKALHLLHSRRARAEKGAVDDVDAARSELAKADGFLVTNPGYQFELLENQTEIQGNLEMLMEAKAEIDTYGPNPGLIGTDIPAESGRAIQLLQAAGIAELGTYMMTYRHWKLRVYRAVWCAAQQFWTAERFIRVTDQEGMAEFVQVNGWEKDEFGYPVAINQLAQLDVEIVLDEGPDSITTMADTFDTMLALGQKGAQIPPEIIIELSSLPGTIKRRIMQLLAQANEPKPMDLQAIQLKLEDIMATIQEKQSKALLNQAKAAEVAAGPTEGPPAQIDTPADLAKARLDMAKATEIEQRVASGGTDKLPTMWDIEEQAASAALKRAQAAKTEQEALTIAQAPPGMLQAQPPRPDPAGSQP